MQTMMPEAQQKGPLLDPSDDPAQPSFPVRQGVLVRARNGDVIRYDSTGLVLRLSDRVIEDIRQRMGAPDPGAGAQAAQRGDLAAAVAALDGLDAWDIRADGDWLRFSARLPGRQGARGFRRHRKGGGIIADAPGPLFGVFGIGGARAALAAPGPSDFPYHVLGVADDIGAVGQSGVDRAETTDQLDQLREMTHEALVAQACLGWQMDKHGPLPLFVARVETDRSASAAELAAGPALDNLMIAADNLRRAAASLGKEARIFAVALDFALEELGGDAVAYRNGMISLMQTIEDRLAERGFDTPVFVARFDLGGPGMATEAQVRGQWELAWNCGDHRLVMSAPGYMFHTDDYARPTLAARHHMAEMTAAAVTAASVRRRTDEPLTDGWRCPLFHLAEVESRADGSAVIRMIAQAASDLTIEPGDAPLDDARPVGFSLQGATNDARITAMSIEPEDAQTILLHLDRMPAGNSVEVAYAWGEPDPGAAVAVRDGWELTAADGRTLRRWALPCLLPVRPGRMRNDD